MEFSEIEFFFVVAVYETEMHLGFTVVSQWICCKFCGWWFNCFLLLQPGPHDFPNQCIIKRSKKNSTFYLYLALTPCKWFFGVTSKTWWQHVNWNWMLNYMLIMNLERSEEKKRVERDIIHFTKASKLTFGFCLGRVINVDFCLLT